MKSTDAFGQDVGMTRVKSYLIFILAFTAITNCVVSLIAYSFLTMDVLTIYNSDLLDQHCIFLLDL